MIIARRHAFLSLIVLIPFLQTTHGLIISGRVADKLAAPIPFPEVCALVIPKFCVFGNDSGFFHMDIPTAIKNSSRADAWLKIQQGSVIGYTPVPGKLVLEIFNTAGKKQNEIRIALPSNAFTIPTSALFPKGASVRGLYVLRVTLGGLTQSALIASFNTQIPLSANRNRVASRSASAFDLMLELEVNKKGYRTEYYPAYSDSSSNWITLSLLNDSGYFRTNGYTIPISSIDTIQNIFHTKLRVIHCEGLILDTLFVDRNLNYGIYDGRLYIQNSPEDCQGMRLSGGTGSPYGTWNMEQGHVELPTPLRPIGCPVVGSYSRPIEPPSNLMLQIDQKGMQYEFYGESCPGEEIYYEVRNLLNPDRNVKMIENTCKSTVFLRPTGERATLTYTPKGGGDSTEALYKSGLTTCKYIDPLFSQDPTPSCPDPTEKAREDFLTCVKNSGFAALPKTSASGLRKAAKAGPQTKVY